MPIYGSAYGPYTGTLRPLSIQNLKQVALLIQTLLGGSRIFEIVSRDPGHAHLEVVLYSLRWRGPSSISVPNLKRIAEFIQKLLRGSRN